MEREVGGGSGWEMHVTPWLIHVNVWQEPLQYCKVISLQLIKTNGKKIRLRQIKKKIHLNQVQVQPTVIVCKQKEIHSRGGIKVKQGCILTGLTDYKFLQHYN